MYSIYIAHFHDCSMRFTHYYPDRPYDHFIDHSQLPGKHARELPVRRIAYSFWQYHSLSIARYPLHLGGVAGQRCHAQDLNQRPLDRESDTLCTTPQKPALPSCLQVEPEYPNPCHDTGVPSLFIISPTCFLYQEHDHLPLEAIPEWC